MTRTGYELWRKHPHVRTGDQLTAGERAADLMRNGFGSWTFVFVFCVFLACWMVVNSYFLTRLAHGKGWDPYPYILLNLCLSCLAALQGAFILIAQKRADRVSAEESLAHYRATDQMNSLLTQNTDLTAAIHAQTERLTEISDRLDKVSAKVGAADG